MDTGHHILWSERSARGAGNGEDQYSQAQDDDKNKAFAQGSFQFLPSIQTPPVLFHGHPSKAV